jgi:hypothetical protein
MPSSKFEWCARVKRVEREHTATRFATGYLMNVAQQDPGSLCRDLRTRDLSEAAERLEGTYTIRIFAEFETCLRMFWQAAFERRPPSRTRDLLDGVGARRKISDDRIHNAHKIREYRNQLVHEIEDAVEPITIDVTRSHLCHYLSFLPIEW